MYSDEYKLKVLRFVTTSMTERGTLEKTLSSSLLYSSFYFPIVNMIKKKS